MPAERGPRLLELLAAPTPAFHTEGELRKRVRSLLQDDCALSGGCQ